MIYPDTIDQDTRRKRIFRIGYSLSQLKPAAALFKGFALGTGQDFGKLSGHFWSTIVRVAPNKDLNVIWIRFVHERHRSWGSARMDCVKFINLSLQFAQFLAGRNIEKPVKLTLRQFRGRIRGVQN